MSVSPFYFLPVLQAAVLDKPKPVARNEMEGGFEERTSTSKRPLLLRKV